MSFVGGCAGAGCTPSPSLLTVTPTHSRFFVTQRGAVLTLGVRRAESEQQDKAFSPARSDAMAVGEFSKLQSRIAMLEAEQVDQQKEAEETLMKYQALVARVKKVGYTNVWSYALVGCHANMHTHTHTCTLHDANPC